MDAKRTEQAEYLTLADGTRLEYRWTGHPKPGEPVLLLLHEGLGCVDMWRDVPERLTADTGLAVCVYSRRGYGRSDPFGSPLDVDFMHREALEVLPQVLDGIGIEQVILMGHSDGASIALVYAGERDDPRIMGLLLLAPHLFVEEETLHGIRQARALFDQGKLGPRLARYHGDHTDSTFNRWCDIWLDDRFREWNIEASIPGIRVPLLAIMGDADEYGTLAQIERIQEILPDYTELSVLPACGHSPHLQQPEATLRRAEYFIRSLPARTGR